MNYELWLGPWIWSLLDGWGPHPLVEHWLELGSTAACGRPGAFEGDTRPMMFCATPPGVMLPSDWLHLGSGDPRKILPSDKVRTSWSDMLGYTPNGDTPADWTMDYRMFGSDPRGLDATAPAMPGKVLQWWFANQLIYERAFDWATDPYAAKCLEVKKLGYREVWEFQNSDAIYKPDAEHIRRMLDYEQKYLNLADYKVLLPDDLKSEIPGTLPHATSYGPEDWNASDSTNISNILTFTETNNDAQLSANACRCVTTGNARVSFRAEHDLSSANHYVEATVASFETTSTPIVGCCGRFAAAAETYYSGSYQCAVANTPQFALAKVVTGTPSAIATFNDTVARPFQIYLSVGNGASDAMVVGVGPYPGTAKITTTDGSFNTGTRFGARLRCVVTTDAIIDNLYANDSFAATNRASLIDGILINRPTIINGGSLVSC